MSDLETLMGEHTGHLVDALNAASAGLFKVANLALVDAEIVASDIAIEVDKLDDAK